MDSIPKTAIIILEEEKIDKYHIYIKGQLVEDNIGTILKDMNIISEEQIEAALHVQKANNMAFGEILVDLNFITTDELARAIAIQTSLEYIDLDAYVPVPEALKLIDEEFAMMNMIIPLNIQDNTLIVATSWPNNSDIKDYLQEKTGYDIQFVVSDYNVISKYLQFYYAKLEDSIEELIESSLINGDTDVVLLLDLIIKYAIKDRTTDIHITPGKLTSHIFFRIDGLRKHAYSIGMDLYNQLVIRIKVLAKLDVMQHLLPQDGDFEFEFPGENYNVRVATIPTQYGEKIALRLLPKNFKIYDLKYLGFESDMVQEISKIIQKTSGIIIVTGSSGSGKTTSLYAMLRKIDILKRNVITVEDPVEHPLPFVDQVQINTRKEYTFNTMLKHIARQDPDVIVIGEILDEDTAKLAIRNSATGHLILSTLSSSSVITAISRLKDLGVNKYLLAEGLLAIVSQRLLRRLCNECKKEVEISKNELIEYFTESKTSILLLPHEKMKIFKSAGCKHCMNSGYVGRICIAEFLQIDDAIRDMIEHDKNTIDIKDHIYSNGYNNIKSDALEKVLKGITSLEEVQRVIH